MPLHFGLLGHNIQYSLSPRIFDLIFREEKIDGKYSLHDIGAPALDKILPDLKNLDGFSVTIPFKEMIISHLDGVSEDAEKIGAVNSVKPEAGGLIGYNTDWKGYLAPLKGFECDFGRALVLGNGGAARAVVYALTINFPEIEIDVCGRALDKVRLFIDHAHGSMEKKTTLRALALDKLNAGERYDLIVNTTPLGGEDYRDRSPLPDEFRFSGTSVCYDLVYRPALTRLARQAEEKGVKSINGLGMLVHQALESYIIWTKKMTDVERLGKIIMNQVNRSEG